MTLNDRLRLFRYAGGPADIDQLITGPDLPIRHAIRLER